MFKGERKQKERMGWDCRRKGGDAVLPEILTGCFFFFFLLLERRLLIA